MLFNQFLRRFFRKVEATDCSLKQEETMGGQAFEYKTHLFDNPAYVTPSCTLTATVNLANGDREEYKEEIQQSGVIDAIAIFRTKEAFGMTNVVGAAFGKLKDPQPNQPQQE